MESYIEKELEMLKQQYFLGEELMPVLEVVRCIINKELMKERPSETWIAAQIFQYGVIWGKRIERAERRGMTQKERFQQWT